jgi:hypothetical protein
MPVVYLAGIRHETDFLGAGQCAGFVAADTDHTGDLGRLAQLN